MTIRAYKQQIFPNAEQKELLESYQSASRFVWNFGLSMISKSYARRKDKTNWMTVSKLITQLKKTSRYEWLNDVPSDVVAQKLRDLDRAYQNFFAKRAKYPRFRKKGSSWSIRFCFDNRHTGKIKSWANGEMVLPKIGKIKLSQKLANGMPKLITISKDGTGAYFASYTVEQNIKHKPKTGSMVGIDMGIKSLATLSNGQVIENPQFLKSMLKTLRKRQKSLSRKHKGSNRWKKQAQRVAKTHAKVRNSRRDYLHKATTAIVENQDIIVVESLRVANMVKNSRLSRSISDTSMSEFISMLEYKCEWYGKEFIKVDTWFASSKTCSCCGHKLDELDLSTRSWECPKCKTRHERDFNASKNILAEGLRITGRTRESDKDVKNCVDFSALASVLNGSETEKEEARIVGEPNILYETGLRSA
jgi:putative transposase